MAAYITFENGNVVDTIVFDATLKEEHTFDADVTEHGVEAGSAVNDNVRAKPDTLKLEVLVTDYPLSTKGSGTGGAAELGRANKVLEALHQLRTDGTRVFVQTSVRSYENLVVKTASTSKDKPVSGALRIVINFIEVREVRTETVQVKTVATAKKKTDLGKQATKPTDEKTARKSYLATGVDGITDALKKVFTK